MIPARFVDIHVYYRTGGINPALCASSFDAVIIQAGVGMWFNPLLPEQIELCNSIGRPYATYHIPDPSAGPMEAQVDAWYARPGVAKAPMIGDIERPTSKDTRCVNADQVRAYMRRIDERCQYAVLAYSRVELLDGIFGGDFPAWWAWRLWIAQYLYETNSTKYSRYEPFLQRWDGRLPPSVTNSKLFSGDWERSLVVGWQFTDSGAARYYLANTRTNDPKYPYGITEADLNVSTIERSEFLALLSNKADQPIDPPTPPTTKGKMLALVDGQRVRSEPKSGALEIARLNAGRYYDFAGEIFSPGLLDNIWAKIKLPDGRVGWAAIQYGRTVYMRSG